MYQMQTRPPRRPPQAPQRPHSPRRAHRAARAARRPQSPQNPREGASKIRAISLKGEYWDAIERGDKTDEYRTWPTSYRGDILICYTAAKPSPGATSIVAELYDCVPIDSGLYAFKLRNVRYFKPFTVIGKQRIFDVDVTIDDLEFITDQDEYLAAFREYADRVNSEIEKKRA